MGQPKIAIGDVVDGKYEITAILGSGAMGVVYEALHQRLQRKVALKTLRLEFSANSRLLERFEREARASSAIGHPNIIQIFDAGGDAGGLPYLAMERLVGQSLGDLLRAERTISTSKAIKTCCEVLEGLGAAHAAGILHRDIKPDNIYLARDNYGEDTVKILDFGISKFLDLSEDGGNDSSTGNLTQAGSLVGTPNYMSPEQICAEPNLDMRADLWAVVCMLYKCLCGRTPFGGKTRQELMAATLQGAFVPLIERCPDVPVALNAIVRRGLMPEREHRYPNAKALLQALKDVHVGSHADTLRVVPEERLTHVLANNETVSDTVETTGANLSMRPEAAAATLDASPNLGKDLDDSPLAVLRGAGPDVASDPSLVAAFDNLADRFLEQESDHSPIAGPTPSASIGATAENALDLPAADPFAPPGADEQVELFLDGEPATGPQPRVSGALPVATPPVAQPTPAASRGTGKVVPAVEPADAFAVAAAAKGAAALAVEAIAPELQKKASARATKRQAAQSRPIVTQEDRPSQRSPLLLGLGVVMLGALAFGAYRYYEHGALFPKPATEPAVLALELSPTAAQLFLNDAPSVERKLTLNGGESYRLLVKAPDRLSMAGVIDANPGASYQGKVHLSHPMFVLHRLVVAKPEEEELKAHGHAAIDGARAKLARLGDCPGRLAEAISTLEAGVSTPESLRIIDRDLSDECGAALGLAADNRPRMEALDDATSSLRASVGAYNKRVSAYRKIPPGEAADLAAVGEQLKTTVATLTSNVEAMRVALSHAQSKWLQLELMLVDQQVGDAMHSQVRNLAVSTDAWTRSHLAGEDNGPAREAMNQYFGFLQTASERRRQDFDASGVTAYLNALKPLMEAAPGEHTLAVHNYSVEVFNKLLLPMNIEVELAKL